MSVFVVETSDQVDTGCSQSGQNPAQRTDDSAEDAPGDQVPGRLPGPGVLGMIS